MRYVALLFLLCSATNTSAEPVVVNIDIQAQGQPISDYIYGSNHEVNGHIFRAARRLGGNRLSAYNWEIDASNAGKDYRHNSDRWLTKQTWWQASAKDGQNLTPGAEAGAIRNFHEESLSRGSYSLVTVPIAGYVVADADGPIAESEAAPSPRWVEAEDGGGVTSYLVKTYGGAADARGVRGYSLGNEPALWHKTHPRMRSKAVTCDELLERSVRTANAIKEADANSEVFGPALWGMTAYASLSKATDWKALQKRGGYDWFIDAYLDRMSRASDQAGHRLLDVLDVHWYTESPKDREWNGDEAARSAKAMYDPQHVEPNWVGDHFSEFLPLLPKLQQSIDRYYPGTKIAITEYDWPMTGTIYGGLTQADALGAFGRHGVYFASYHHYTHDKPDQYVGSAFTLFQNYDGNGSTFGDQSLPVIIESQRDLDIYAALDKAANTLHAVVICREAVETSELILKLGAKAAPVKSESWFFDAESPTVRAGPAPQIQSDGRVTLAVPPLSVWHIVLSLP